MATVSVRSAIQDSVPISNFNKGMAGKIFADVRSSGPKVVIKNNNPECVLMSPEEYISMLDEIEDMRLMLLAKERTKNAPERVYSQDEVMKELGISEDDLNAAEDTEIE